MLRRHGDRTEPHRDASGRVARWPPRPSGRSGQVMTLQGRDRGLPQGHRLLSRTSPSARPRRDPEGPGHRNARHPVDGLRGVGVGQHRESDCVGCSRPGRDRCCSRTCHTPGGSTGRTAPGGAAPDRLLRCRLHNLGTGEQTARRDAVVDERLVVAATAELRVVVRLVPGRVEGLERVLDRYRPRRDRHRAPEVDWSASYTLKT